LADRTGSWLTLATDAHSTLSLPWQLGLWDSLIRRIEQQKLPHALLLNGSEGIGVERLVAALIGRLICLSPQNNYACGHCKTCQLVQAGTHPDVLPVVPEEQGKAIKIQQIRDLCSALEKTSQQGGWKVAVISPAEAMNIAAANALLKNLEEPQDRTLMILVSHRPGLLPATIRSRCQIENMPIPDRNSAIDWLNEVAGDNDKNSQILDIAGGRPLLALQYLQGDGIEQRGQVEGLLDAIRRGKVAACDAAQQCQKYDADQAIGWTMSYVHRLATTELKDQPNMALFNFSDKLNTARGWVLSGSNINTQLLWEELFIEWSQVFHPRN